MRAPRRIRRILKARATVEGAGVHLKRAFGFQEVPQLDPFLLLDDFHSDRPPDYLSGFPWHPHRGIETITYVLHGEVEHADSMGNRGVIRAGNVQWMTAGSGIIHQELPRGDAGGLLWGFQLWANLPAAHKMMPPRYREVKRADIPEVELENGARVKIICGKVQATRGPVSDIVIEPEYLDVRLPSLASFDHPVPGGRTAFAYVVEGNGSFGRRSDAPETTPGSAADALVGPEHLVLFDDGDRVFVSAGDSPLRFLLVSGSPIAEPVAWHGPIVMNTQEELETAFEEYRQGTFIRHTGTSR